MADLDRSRALPKVRQAAIVADGARPLVFPEKTCAQQLIPPPPARSVPHIPRFRHAGSEGEVGGLRKEQICCRGAPLCCGDAAFLQLDAAHAPRRPPQLLLWALDVKNYYTEAPVAEARPMPHASCGLCCYSSNPGASVQGAKGNTGKSYGAAKKNYDAVVQRLSKSPVRPRCTLLHEHSAALETRPRCAQDVIATVETIIDKELDMHAVLGQARTALACRSKKSCSCHVLLVPARYSHLSRTGDGHAGGVGEGRLRRRRVHLSEAAAAAARCAELAPHASTSDRRVSVDRSGHRAGNWGAHMRVCFSFHRRRCTSGRSGVRRGVRLGGGRCGG